MSRPWLPAPGVQKGNEECIRDSLWRHHSSAGGGFVKKSVVVISVLAVLVAVGFFYLRHGYVYEISQADIQGRIETHFPVERCVLVFCIELSEPFVRLSDTQTRIEFGSDALMEVAFSKNKYDGNAGFSGELRYLAKEGAFYLQDSRLEYLEMNGVSEEHRKNLNELAAMLVSEYLRANPIYSLRNTVFGPVAPWLELKEVDIRGGVLRLRLGLAV
jgi:hypothetical protein